MKAVKTTLAGREQYLVFTGEAMFQLREKFGETKELIGAMKPDTREGLSAAVQAAVILAEQGGLARRYMGYDKTDVADAEAITATITPAEITPLKLAIIAAIELGFGREIKEENDEVDLGLAELNSKKKRPDRPRFLRMALLCGMSKKEALLSCPGEVYDLFELYLRANGLKKKPGPEDE